MRAEELCLRPVRPDDAAILLVEDDEQLRSLLRSVLEEAGYLISIAESSHEALQIVSQLNHFKLLIADVQMPGMAGTDLAKQLSRTWPNIRVLLISGYSQNRIALESGWQFLKKPFLPSEIVRIVNDILSDPETERP